MSFYANSDWTRTNQGTPIPLFASEPLFELKGKNPILLMGGIHGDEPEGVRLAQDTLDWLVRAQNIDQLLAPWIIIPILNVDGYKNRTRVNGSGVDLNRNYPSKDWSPNHDRPRYFPGPNAASEGEIRGVVALVETLRPRLLIHCHSWKPCIVATGELAQTDGKRLAASSGYELTTEIGYPTPGSLSRFGWHDHKIPVICIEENDKLEDFNTIWPRFQNGIKEIFLDVGLRV